jgi:hypothetical protein
VSNERQQLAATAAVLDRLDGTLNDLFASVAELKTSLGLPLEVAPVTAPEPPAPLSALETAQALQRAIEAMRKDLKAATERLSTAEQREQRRWRVTVGLIVSFAFDIILTVVVTIATVQAHTASERASATVAELRATQLASCRSSNQTRAEQDTIWHELAGLSKPAPGTSTEEIAKQKKAVKGFLALVDKAEAPRNCGKLYGSR